MFTGAQFIIRFVLLTLITKRICNTLAESDLISNFAEHVWLTVFRHRVEQLLGDYRKETWETEVADVCDSMTYEDLGAQPNQILWKYQGWLSVFPINIGAYRICKKSQKLIKARLVHCRKRTDYLIKATCKYFATRSSRSFNILSII